MGEAAADRSIMPFRDNSEQATEFWQDLAKIGVHGEDVPARCGTISVPERQPHAVWFRSIQQMDTWIGRSQSLNHGSGFVCAVVVHDDNFVNIGAIETQKSLDEAANSLGFIVSWHYYGN